MGNDIYNKVKLIAEEYCDLTAQNLSNLVLIKSLSCDEKEFQQELKRQMEVNGADDAKIDGLGNMIGRLGKGLKIIVID
jgi:putative aminopeptidase FrvX